MEIINRIKKYLPKGDRNTSLPRLWQITVGDVNSFTELWSLKITVRRLLAMVAIAAAVIAMSGILLVVATPLRSLLPGYLGGSTRGDYETMAQKLDSLSAVSEYHNDYLSNIAAIFNDEVTTDIPDITTEAVDSVGLIPVDSILPTSEAERKFVKQYEQREKHNLSVLSPIAAEGITFYRPVASAAVDDSESAASREVTLLTNAGSRVSSIYRGTVVATWFDPSTSGISVSVQHPRDFLSIYSGLQTVYVNKGDKVNAGTPIGITPQKQSKLKFELWHNGSQLNPRDYVAF